MSADNTYILLVAGIGKRLLPITKNTPKCLARLDEKITLLDLTLSQLNHFGGNIILVCGYKKEKIKDNIKKKINSYQNLTFNIVENDGKFKENFYSVYLGLTNTNLKKDVVIINGDVIFETNILMKLINEKNTSMVIDKRRDLDNEDMKVKIADGYIKKIGKNLSISESDGEYIGLLKINKKDVVPFLDSLNLMMTNNIEDWYERGLQFMIDKGIKIIPLYTQNNIWKEIDNIEDLKYARKIFKVMSKKNLVVL